MPESRSTVHQVDTATHWIWARCELETVVGVVGVSLAWASGEPETG